MSLGEHFGRKVLDEKVVAKTVDEEYTGPKYLHSQMGFSGWESTSLIMFLFQILPARIKLIQ